MKAEVLRYLDYDNQILDDVMNKQIDHWIKESQKFPGKYAYKIYDLARDPLSIKDYKAFEGNSVSYILSQSKKVILFAATLGSQFDKELQRLKYKSSTDMMIFNACGSAAIEEIVDKMVKDLEEKHPYITPRYSPGYGDFPLTFQKDIIQLLNDKTLGIWVNDASLMLPVKSVTGIIGVSDELMTVTYRKCDDCLQRMTCEFKVCRR